MYLVFDKDTIEREIIPHLPVSERGFAPQAPLYEIVNAILYKLVTGVQWAYLPVGILFSGRVLHYKTVLAIFANIASVGHGKTAGPASFRKTTRGSTCRARTWTAATRPP